MGLGQKYGGKNRGKHGKTRKERQPKNKDYKDIVMEMGKRRVLIHKSVEEEGVHFTKNGRTQI